MSKHASSEHTPMIKNVDGDAVVNCPGGAPVAGVPLYPDLPPEECQQRFVVGGYRDAWAAVLFVASFAAVTGRAIYAYAAKEIHVTRTEVWDLKFSRAMEYILAVTAFAATASFLFMLLMRHHPRGYIIFSNLFLVALYLGGGIACFAAKATVGGIFFVLVAALVLLLFVLARSRIPVSAALLRHAVNVTFRYPGTITMSVGAVLANVVNGFVFVSTFYALYATNTIVSDTYDEDTGRTEKTMNGGQFALAASVVLVFYWTNQVIFNVIHVAVSGVGATVYYLGNNMPSNPTLASLKRAMTTSFGSICFGSLVVAVLQLMHTICRAMAGSRRGGFVTLVAMCFLRCLERLVEYFNLYAFTYVAIYGDSYVTAAKKCWNLIVKAPCAVVFTNNLAYTAVYVSVMIIAGVAAALAGLASHWHPAPIILSAVWALLLSLLFLRVVPVQVTTLFVCVAEDFEALRGTDPALHQEIAQAIEEARQKQSCY